MDKLKIALQKKGRLSEKSLELIRECGISLTNGSRKLLSVSSDFPLEAMYLRDDDIPRYVSDGVADIGIVGVNVVKEESVEVEILENLGFARCRLSLAVPKSIDYPGLEFFEGKKVATSYPMILRGFFNQHEMDVDIHEIS